MIWILVETTKRSYCVRGDAKVVWLPGEKVIRMEAVK